MKILLRIGFILFIAHASFAQQLHTKGEVGGLLGVTNYLGDLNKSDVWAKEPKPAVGVFGRYNFNTNWALRGGLTFGKLSGSDANYTARAGRGFSTSSPITDLSGIMEYDFRGKKRFTYDSVAHVVRFRKTFSPYIALGLGLGFTNPNPNFTGTATTGAQFRQGATADQAAKYSKVNPVIPFGFGVRYDLNERWVLGAEWLVRFAFSDYLDGVSKAANPERNDKYSFTALSLSYRLDKKDKDRDGIPDDKDECPNEPGSVKMKGCPDRDKDGVADKNDDCPDTFGLAEFGGCPDSDGDGVRDKDDDCPNEAGLASLKGCPDRDKDGIADKDDDCPDQAGLASLKGCPDRDKDGIADKDDTCPDVAGLASLKGCPDKDGDGIADKDDTCPDVVGLASLKGCPDKDGDGITDKDDDCPDQAGVAFLGGCPDTDGDSIADAKDRCPTIAGKSEFDGCPDAKTLRAVIKREQANAKLALKADNSLVIDFNINPVLFETNLSTIRPEYTANLDEVVATLIKNPNHKVVISGHADSSGPKDHNHYLSQIRAKACRDYIISKGISPNRIRLLFFGDKSPVSDNDTAEGRSSNRRSEFKIRR